MFPTANTADKPDELPSLTGLRFFAAFFVLVAHTGYIVPPVLLPRYNSIAAHLVFFGMTLFFVLSGFVITYNYLDLFRTKSKREATYTFLSARTARLMPLYVCIFILTLATVGLAQAKTKVYLFPVYLTNTVQFISFWANNTMQPGLWNFGVVWSISAEWLFYLIFPAFSWILIRIRTARVALAAMAVLFGAGVGFIYLMYADNGAHCSLFVVTKGAPPASYEGWNIGVVYGCGPFRMFEFMIGCLAARYFLLIRHVPPMCRERTLAHAAFALACGLTLALEKHLGGRNPITTPGQYSFLESLRTNLLHVPFIVFIILYTLRYQSPAAWFLNLKPIVKGGEASYSMYLLHPWLMYLFPWRGEATAPRSAELVSETVVRCGIIFLFIIIVARGTYLAIEVPGKRIVRSAAKRFGSNGRFTAWAIAAFYLLPIAGVVASVQLFFRYG